MIRRRHLTMAAAVAATAAALLAAAWPAPAEPYASDWNSNEQVDMRLVSAVAAVGDLQEIRLGLEFRMRPGWKIYWRSPGQAGFPPEADWSKSSNLAAVDTAWPAPHRFTIFDLETMGYKDEVILPLTVRPDAPGRPLQLRAEVNYLTCKELCIPAGGVLSLDLPAGPAAPTPAAAAIDRYRAQVPVPAEVYGIDVAQAVIMPRDEDALLRIAIRSETPLGAPDLFVEGPVSAFFAKPDIDLSPDGRRAVMTLKGMGATADELAAGPLLVTLVDGDRAVERSVSGSVASEFPVLPDGFGGPARPAAAVSLWVVLGFALLGGLILNLMPCVLPVLSLKFLSVLGHGGRENAEVRLGFLASVAGIIASFMVLAGFLAALKLAGASIGWGIQFQQPVFLAIMVVIVTLFACNLFGFFEIQLPRRINDLIALDTGPRHDHHHSLGGHFLTGMLATLLATPCSAPFLGTAVGFAMSRGTAEIFMVFGALGLGLSAPYLLIAAFPGMATRLPRPGAWMVAVKRFLGLLLAATALWLVTVIAAETGTDIAVGVAALAVLMGAVLGLQRLEGSRLGRHAGLVAVALALAIVAAPVFAPESPANSGKRTIDSALWRPFDQAELRRLVADGRTVLVDVTADWCITCQVNKAAVLNRDPVAGVIEDGTVVAMRADWTNPDQEIADYLAGFGRYGIPFNAVYGPRAPDGVLLPEILVGDRVLAAFEQAGGPNLLANR